MGRAQPLSYDLEVPEDDQDLMKRVAAHGDREAFQCLFLRFGPG